jgi:hypothetical protein
VKVFLLLIGLLSGAAASVAWRLSEPTAGDAAGPGDRFSLLKTRITAALAEGEAEAGATENKLRHELAAYRLHPDRAAVS